MRQYFEDLWGLEVGFVTLVAASLCRYSELYRVTSNFIALLCMGMVQGVMVCQGKGFYQK